MNYDNLDNFEPVARIVVLGVGGAGTNAVNRMIEEQISSVEFYVLNSDRQSLANSKAPNKVVLGAEITGGLGAGGEPSVGKAAAQISAEEIRKIVKGADMVFIAAGMGGGTGTGAAPIVAAIAKEEEVLTVAIVTRPFTFEGKKRIANSIEGLNALKDNVDSIIIVSNDKLLMASGTQPISEAFQESDRVLAQSVKTVTDLILMPAIINLDFADVKNTLKNSGVALIGFGMGSGRDRAVEAAVNAINSPLLEASINGARRAICAVTCGPSVTLFEAQEAVDRVIESAGSTIDIKFGISINDMLTDQIIVSVIASDFTEEYDYASAPTYDSSYLRTHAFSRQNASSLLSKEKEEEEENNFLPNFLKNKRNI